MTGKIVKVNPSVHRGVITDGVCRWAKQYRLSRRKRYQADYLKVVAMTTPDAHRGVRYWSTVMLAKKKNIKERRANEAACTFSSLDDNSRPRIAVNSSNALYESIWRALSHYCKSATVKAS